MQLWKYLSPAVAANLKQKFTTPSISARVFELREQISLVVVMTAVNLWNPWQLVLSRVFAATDSLRHFVKTVENKSAQRGSRSQASVSCTSFNKISPSFPSLLHRIYQARRAALNRHTAAHACRTFWVTRKSLRELKGRMEAIGKSTATRLSAA